MKLLKASIVIAALALGACSQGTGSMIPAQSTGSAMRVPSQSLATVSSDTSPESQTQSTAKVSFLIQWPKPKADLRRHSRFISPSTMSVVLQTGTGKNAVTAIANNEGKPTTLLELDAPVGKDTFVVSLYDAVQTAGKPVAGQELGQGEAEQTVVAGKVNPLHVVIDGVISKIGVVLDPNSVMANLSGSLGQQTLTVFGDAPAIVKLEPLDGDGNVIVAPGVVPSINLQVGVESTGGIAITPIPHEPNTYAVSLLLLSNNRTLGLVATATDGQGGTITANLPIVQTQAIYVSYGSGSGSRIAAYDKSGHLMPLPKTAFSGITSPVALAYDSDDHQIFVADASGKILAFDGAGNRLTNFPALSVPGVTSLSYFNAFAAGNVIPQILIPHRQRLIVGGSSGITEFDATSGAQLISASLPFTPTAVAGSFDPNNPLISPSAWLILVGNPNGFIEPYDLVTLAAYSSHTLLVSPSVPAGFGYIQSLYVNPFTDIELLQNMCVDQGSITQDQSFDFTCLYVATGATSHIVRFGNSLGKFGQSGLRATNATVTEHGALNAITIDPLDYAAAVVRSDNNSIEEFQVTDSYGYTQTGGTFGLSPRSSFTTPSSLGFSNPNSIAIEW